MVLIADTERFESSSDGGSQNVLLYNLRVNTEFGSIKKRDFKDGKKFLEGCYEDVWFLNKFNSIGIISFHRSRDGKERILCHKTFNDSNKCPACDSYQNATNRQNHHVKAKEQELVVPVLAVRRQHDPHYHKNKFQITPVYWFDLNITSYQEDRYENYLRLRAANEKHPIHKYPYRIFAKKRGEKEKQQYYFKAIGESEKTDIITDHPLIDDFMDKKGRWTFDKDHQEMLNSFAVVRYKQYVDPSTSEVFEYDGLYQECLDQYLEFSEGYPDCRTELDEPLVAQEDEEELD